MKRNKPAHLRQRCKASLVLHPDSEGNPCIVLDKSILQHNHGPLPQKEFENMIFRQQLVNFCQEHENAASMTPREIFDHCKMLCSDIHVEYSENLGKIKRLVKVMAQERAEKAKQNPETPSDLAPEHSEASVPDSGTSLQY